MNNRDTSLALVKPIFATQFKILMKRILCYYDIYELYLIIFLIIINTSCIDDSVKKTGSPLIPVEMGSVNIGGELALRIQKSEQLISNLKYDSDTIIAAPTSSKIIFPTIADEVFWNKYVKHGMSENHGNYESFDVFDKSSDPCIVFQSFFYAVNLWRTTKNEKFRDEAELIYYNGICHLQKNNGNWGKDNTPGNKIQDVCLKSVNHETSVEKTLFCTQALHQIANMTYFISDDTLYIPFLRESELNTLNKNKALHLNLQTNYPFDQNVIIKIENNSAEIGHLMIAAPSWTKNHQLFINDDNYHYKIINGFILINKTLKKGDRIKFYFEQILRFTHPINKKNTNLDQYKIYSGPFILGYKGKEVIKLTSLEKIIPLENQDYLIGKTGIIINPIYIHPDENEFEINRKKQILF